MEIKQCPNCGKFVKGNAKFCKNCGTRFDLPPEEEDSKEVVLKRGSCKPYIWTHILRMFFSLVIVASGVLLIILSKAIEEMPLLLCGILCAVGGVLCLIIWIMFFVICCKKNSSELIIFEEKSNDIIVTSVNGIKFLLKPEQYVSLQCKYSTSYCVILSYLNENNKLVRVNLGYTNDFEYGVKRMEEIKNKKPGPKVIEVKNSKQEEKVVETPKAKHNVLSPFLMIFAIIGLVSFAFLALIFGIAYYQCLVENAFSIEVTDMLKSPAFIGCIGGYLLVVLLVCIISLVAAGYWNKVKAGVTDYLKTGGKRAVFLTFGIIGVIVTIPLFISIVIALGKGGINNTNPIINVCIATSFVAAPICSILDIIAFAKRP